MKSATGSLRAKKFTLYYHDITKYNLVERGHDVRIRVTNLCWSNASLILPCLENFCACLFCIIILFYTVAAQKMYYRSLLARKPLRSSRLRCYPLVCLLLTQTIKA